MTNEERYVLVEVPPGGLLLDRESGLTLELNAAAALAWRLHLAGEAFDAIVTRFATHFQISLETASADVNRSLRDVPLPEAAARSGEFRYQRSKDGYVFSRNGEAVFVVDESGDKLTAPNATRFAPEALGILLYGLCPKLLSLRGHTVLHASAVAIGGRAIAFSGHSGAGKTATAHALVRAGATLLCEDKLVLHRNTPELAVFATCENALRRWVNVAVVDLTAGHVVSCAALDTPPTGPEARLNEIGFVSAEGRAASRQMAVLPASALQAAGAIFKNSFHGSDASSDWVLHLKTSARIAQKISGYDLTMPDGLELLPGAVGPIVAGRSLKLR